jgi:hypothetical protein
MPNPLDKSLPGIVATAFCVLTFQDISKRPDYVLQLTACARETCRRQPIDKILQDGSVHPLNLCAFFAGDYDAFFSDAEVSGLATLGTAGVSKPRGQVSKLLQHSILVRPCLSDGLSVFV